MSLDTLFFISQKRQRAGRSRDDDDRGMLEKSDMKNERFTSYYKAQRIIPEEEWDEFMEALKRPLPTTFRIAGSRECVLIFFLTVSADGSVRIAHVLNDAIEKTYVPMLSDVVFEGDPVPPPSHIPWCGMSPYMCYVRLTLCWTRYPEGLAWQFNISKKVLRRQQAFKRFHSFLVHETEVVCDALSWVV